MDLETENRIAAILMKEAAELRRQAEKDGVHAYLQQPTVRGRPNSRFLTATVLGVQQAKRKKKKEKKKTCYQKVQESTTVMHKHPRTGFEIFLSNRAVEVNEMWRVRQKELELDDRLKGRQREDSSSHRSHRDLSDSPRSSSKRHAATDKNASALCSSSKRVFEEYYSREDGGLRDEEIEEFLCSRVKRGRGAVGSRMDETGPFPLDPKEKLSTCRDVRIREEWEGRVLGPEKSSSLKSSESSEEELHQDRRKKTKIRSSSSNKQHSRKHGSKEKSRDKKKKREEKRCKHRK